MLGYGTADCAAADTITGPGNVHVAAAKRLLRGTVSTDAEAGPTEIAILADATADPAFVAAGLIAQAEHDPLAACLLITTDPGRRAEDAGGLLNRASATSSRNQPDATGHAALSCSRPM